MLNYIYIYIYTLRVKGKIQNMRNDMEHVLLRKVVQIKKMFNDYVHDVAHYASKSQSVRRWTKLSKSSHSLDVRFQMNSLLDCDCVFLLYCICDIVQCVY